MKKLIYILGVVAILLPSVSFADSPMKFDKWSMNSGKISAECTTGYLCGSALTDYGFYQRTVQETSTGRSYFHSIITESGQSGSAGDTNMSFSDESFVGIGRGVYGLADKQHVVGSSPDGVLTFDAENTILTGWATSRGLGTDVEFDFNQVIQLGFDTGVEGKNQTFDMRQRIADTVGSLDMGLTASFDPAVTYASGNYIRATWFNQDAEGQPFGWQRYEEDPYGTNTTIQAFWSMTTIAAFDDMDGEFVNQVDAPFNTTLQ